MDESALELTPLVEDAIRALQEACAEDLEALAKRAQEMLTTQRPIRREDAEMARGRHRVLGELLASTEKNLELLRRMTRGGPWVR